MEWKAGAKSRTMDSSERGEIAPTGSLEEVTHDQDSPGVEEAEDAKFSNIIRATCSLCNPRACLAEQS